MSCFPTAASTIADLYCFSSPAHFSTAFRRYFGYTPIHARSALAGARDVGGVFEGWRKIIEAGTARQSENSTLPAPYD